MPWRNVVCPSDPDLAIAKLSGVQRLVFGHYFLKIAGNCFGKSKLMAFDKRNQVFPGQSLLLEFFFIFNFMATDSYSLQICLHFRQSERHSFKCLKVIYKTGQVLFGDKNGLFHRLWIDGHDHILGISLRAETSGPKSRMTGIPVGTKRHVEFVRYLLGVEPLLTICQGDVVHQPRAKMSFVRMPTPSRKGYRLSRGRVNSTLRFFQAKALGPLKP
uniref:Uncharacterized protein n=1 Tax=Desulfovibrio sp. U5L TaxID=596152 RepID=I2Q7N7_9BACT